MLQALYTYLNPLVGGAATGPGAGWPFGRMLNQGELYQIAHSVDGVEFVKILRVYETDLRTGEQSRAAGRHAHCDRARRGDRLRDPRRQGRPPQDIMSDERGQPDGDGQVVDGTREITGFVTYSGDGFAVVRARAERGDSPTPKPATNRRYLRDGLPAIYREDDFAMRFVAALESVLDPIVGMLDGLPAHFDPELAPLDILDLATGWLGLAHNEAQPASQLRELVRRAAELGRLRGTHAGVELALKLNFPELALRIEDGGACRLVDRRRAAQALAAGVRGVLRHPDLAERCRDRRPRDRVGQARARLLPATRQGSPQAAGGQLSHRPHAR